MRREGKTHAVEEEHNIVETLAPVGENDGILLSDLDGVDDEERVPGGQPNTE